MGPTHQRYHPMTRVITTSRDYYPISTRKYWATLDNSVPCAGGITSIAWHDAVVCSDRAEAIDVVWEFNTAMLLGTVTTLKETLNRVRTPGYVLPPLVNCCIPL